MSDGAQASKKSIWVSIKDNTGFLASAVAVVTFVGGFFGWELGSGQVEGRVEEVADISSQQLKEAILALPEERQEIFAPLFDAIDDLSGVAAGGAGAEEAAERINNAVTSIADVAASVPVKNYDISVSPFHLPFNQTRLICDRAFSVAYSDSKFNTTRIGISVNGRWRGLKVGNTVSADAKDKTLTLTILDHMVDDKEVVLLHECS